MSKINLKNILSLAAAILGLVTLFASSSVLFGYSDILGKEGNYPSLILWVNLVSGPLFLLAAAGIKYSKKWTFYVLLGILTLLIYSLSFFIQLMISGKPHETDTLGALILRISFTGLLTFYVSRKNYLKMKI